MRRLAYCGSQGRRGRARCGTGHGGTLRTHEWVEESGLQSLPRSDRCGPLGLPSAWVGDAVSSTRLPSGRRGRLRRGRRLESGTNACVVFVCEAFASCPLSGPCWPRRVTPRTAMVRCRRRSAWCGGRHRGTGGACRRGSAFVGCTFGCRVSRADDDPRAFTPQRRSQGPARFGSRSLRGRCRRCQRGNAVCEVGRTWVRTWCACGRVSSVNSLTVEPDGYGGLSRPQNAAPRRV